MADHKHKANNEGTGGEGIPTASYSSGAVGFGEQIGPYKLLRILGEGGYGIVYLAERQRPVKRRVALKVIKPGMDTKQVIARFEAERQALALLDHPNIAHVFNAGTTKTGRPYFAMEYVKGVPITEHCDRYKLTIEERLKLFMTVCEAVQYAHQKAIIHRDIKPSNILVAYEGEKAVPMIIDFGVAKALSQSLTERTLVTEQAQMIGTPEYMSPEQAEMTGQDIDTRTDVYSLGALLYELLTGTLPFDPQTLREAGIEGMRRMIREQDPKTPSVRLSTIEKEKSLSLAGLRRTDIRTLERRLHGELDWITLKAMDKDRTRRYQTAYALAEDIQRYLNQEPVLAGPPSTIYKFRKFAARNKGVFVSVATIAVVVVLAAIISIILAITATEAKKAEIQQRQKAETLAKQQEEDLYYNHIKLAHQALNDNRPVVGLDYLNKCPKELRNWEWHYLYRKSYSQEQSELIFDANVVSFDVSPDGSKLAALCADGNLVIRDLSTEKDLPIKVRDKKQPNYDDRKYFFFDDYKDPFMQWVAFCPDGKHMAVATDDCNIELISLDSGASVQSYTGLENTVTQLDCSPDGKLIAAASYGSRVLLWNLESGERLKELDFDFLQTSLGFTGDGKLLFVGGGQRIKVYNVEELINGKENRESPIKIGYEIREYAASPDGQLIATALWDDTIRLSNNKNEEIICLKGHLDGIRGVAFNDDGTRLASISDDQTIRLWDTQTAHDREILVLDGFDPFLQNIAFSKEMCAFIAGDFTHSLKVLSACPIVGSVTSTTTILSEHTETLYTVNYNPSGHQIITSGHDGIPRIWDALNGKLIGHINMGGQDSCNAQFSPNGDWIASMGIDGGRWVVKVLEVDPPRYTERFKVESEMEMSGLTFSADSNYLIIGKDNYDLIVYDMRSDGKKGIKLGQQDGFIITIVASPDGKYLASVGYNDGGIKIWDANRLSERQEGRVVYSNNITHFRPSFSPDGKRLAVGGRDGEIRILYVESGETLLPIPNAHGDKVSCVSFSPDGDYLASCSSDKTVRVWDTKIGRQVDIFLKHEGRVLSVAFSPDGEHVASVGADKKVRIWIPRLE